MVSFESSHTSTRSRDPSGFGVPDVGSLQLFECNASQEAQAKSFIAKLTAQHLFKAPIATRIEHGGFYPAEDYHQDYARKHPWQPYIVINDRPKVVALRRQYPSLFKA